MKYGRCTGTLFHNFIHIRMKQLNFLINNMDQSTFHWCMFRWNMDLWYNRTNCSNFDRHCHKRDRIVPCSRCHRPNPCMGHREQFARMDYPSWHNKLNIYCCTYCDRCHKLACRWPDIGKVLMVDRLLIHPVHRPSERW